MDIHKNARPTVHGRADCLAVAERSLGGRASRDIGGGRQDSASGGTAFSPKARPGGGIATHDSTNCTDGRRSPWLIALHPFFVSA